MSDVAAFLDENTGELHPAFKFDHIGATCKGVITARPKVRDMINKFTNAVEPTLILTVEQDDGETVTLYAKRGFMLSAIGDAVRTVTGKGEIEPGARIAVRYTEDRDVNKGNAAKIYVAQYEAPTPANVTVDGLL